MGKQLLRGEHILKENITTMDLSMVLNTTDVVIQMMSIGDSHKAIALLDKSSGEKSLQRVSEYVTAVCTEAGVMVRIEMFKSSKDQG